MLQGETKPIRRLVEARFDEIKAITEGARPTLPPDTSSWCASRAEVSAYRGKLISGDNVQGPGSVWEDERWEKRGTPPPHPVLLAPRLQHVTWVCREEVAAIPTYVHKRLAPMMRLLKDGPQQRGRRQHDSCAGDAGSQQDQQAQPK
jgi:hypothetical protein